MSRFIDNSIPEEPYDPMCGRFAKDMADYDSTIAETQEELDKGITPEQRVEYVRQNEGTFNPQNGHFLCDMCYIKAGMPSSPSGWKCP